MSKKVTLNLKVNAYPHCKYANKAKLRQHLPDYCSTGFEAHGGHCANFEANKPKRTTKDMPDILSYENTGIARPNS